MAFIEANITCVVVFYIPYSIIVVYFMPMYLLTPKHEEVHIFNICLSQQTVIVF